MSVNSPEISVSAGIRIPKGACVVIVRTEWNADIIDILEEGCKGVLRQYNIQHKTILVPGAFELSFAVKRYWDAFAGSDEGRPVAFITLGCVLRGDTPHFDYVCKAVTEGVVQLNLQLPVPTIFGVLTVDNREQADERTTGKHGNKGAEAAITALKMIELNHSFGLKS